MSSAMGYFREPKKTSQSPMAMWIIFFALHGALISGGVQDFVLGIDPPMVS
jgi:hypothetical protein